MLDIQCFCVEHSSNIYICQSEKCLSTSFHSCFIVSPLCSFFFFTVQKHTSGLSNFIIYIQSVFVLVSEFLDIYWERKRLQCFWIKAHDWIDLTYQQLNSLLLSRFWQQWRETIWYTWKKQNNRTINYFTFLFGVYWICFIFWFTVTFRHIGRFCKSVVFPKDT